MARVKAEEAEALKTHGKPHCLRTRKEINEIREAEYVISVSVNSDTGEFIPWVMRMSSFIPVQMPMAYGMLMTAPTPFNTIIWQWANQTYNAVLNYGNRNASSTYTTTDIMKSYASAVTLAIGTSLGIRQLLSPLTKGKTGAGVVFVSTLSTYVACALAGFANCYLMRQTELNKGINVINPETNQPLGLSKKCAEVAVYNTAVSRFGMAAPLFIPAILFFAFDKIKMVPTQKHARILFEMGLCFLNCYMAVPLSVAMFPKYGKISAAEIEAEFHNIPGKDGQPIKEFIYNKGM